MMLNPTSQNREWGFIVLKQKKGIHYEKSRID